MIETERLILRPPTVDDAEAIATQIGEWEVAKMLSGVPYPYAVSDAHWWIGISAQGLLSGAAFNMLIEPKGSPNNQIVGCVGIEEKDEVPDGREIGYWLGKDHWGQGYATEAATAMRDYAFNVRGYELLMSGAFTENPASLNVLRKLGFAEEKNIKRYCRARDEELDLIELRLTRDSWLSSNGFKGTPQMGS